jgi:hypothetical protein
MTFSFKLEKPKPKPPPQPAKFFKKTREEIARIDAEIARIVEMHRKVREDEAREAARIAALNRAHLEVAKRKTKILGAGGLLMPLWGCFCENNLTHCPDCEWELICSNAELLWEC